jgi:hypothetical protein
MITIDKNSGAITIPAGFTLIHEFISGDLSTSFVYKVATGGETAVSWSWVNSQDSSVWVAEYSGLLSVSPLDVDTENDSGGGVVTSISTGTTPITTQADQLAVAFMGADTGTSVETGRAWSNGFVEDDFLGPGGGAGQPGLSAAIKILNAIATQETTFSTTDTGDQMWASLATFKGAGVGKDNMTLVSDDFTAVAQPDTALLMCLLEEVDAIVLNTDLIGEVSRDGGTTWTAVTLEDVGDYSTTRKIIRGSADISGQPAGTTPKYRFRSLNNKNFKLHMASLGWD